MTKFKLIACCIASLLFLGGCNKILEPVSLFDVKQDFETKSVQEDFEINIKNLTFENAKKANNAPYPRQIMLTGIGSQARVYDEAKFISSIFPPLSPASDYLLGIGDKLIFKQINEFVQVATQFPPLFLEKDYLIGVGDKLTLIQLNADTNGLNNIVSKIQSPGNNINIGTPRENDSLLKTSGIVGTNGNILLLGLGNIKAENRTLHDLQTEVRNILIRNGLAPNFQLEIDGFNSKKAFITFPNPNQKMGHNTVKLTNLPITLKELAINYGMRSSSQNTTIITLTRNNKKFYITSSKFFDQTSPDIIIQDGDHIEINEVKENTTSMEVVVGSRGNILIEGLGSFKAKNRSLAELQVDITRAISKLGQVPNFQLEITDYKSQEFFLITENYGSKAIALNKSQLNLKDAVLSNLSSNHNNKNLTIVELIRNGREYRMTLQEVLNQRGSETIIQNNDTIRVKDFEYKPGQVFALSGAGNAQMVSIDPSKRETLADILFTEQGAFNNLLAKRSEVYLLRGQNPSNAYHLDAQNVSRILVAAKTELRPNDIVYVADRPIISFSRTLLEILPLRILLRDIQDNNIP